MHVAEEASALTLCFLECTSVHLYDHGVYCTVVTAARSPGIGNGLTYEVPAGVDVQPGMLVRAPMRGKVLDAIVVDVSAELSADVKDVKRITEVLSSTPVLTAAQVRTARWMALHYRCTLRHALAVWLPPPPWASLLPKEIAYVRMVNPSAPLKGKKQELVADYLRGRDWMPLHELKRETGVGPAVIKTLTEKGVIQAEIRRPDGGPQIIDHSPALKGLPVLTTSQARVEREIKADPRPSLLFGVTGSGKTEIYAQLIADTIKAGRQAIVLVPEILLTEHSVIRYTSLLNREAIAVLHSRLTPASRREIWRKVRAGEIALVLGSRSALFAPLPNLGLIIMDEEHEWTFKNEQTPRYHARETAEELCKNSSAKLVFGTATPSLEAWMRAKEGRYHLERLSERYKEQAMPDVKVVDLATVKFGQLYPFSPDLLNAIQDRLNKGEQSVLFLNRRGIATSVLCLDCRRRVVSPESLLPFTMHTNHSGRPYLLDHTSGLIVDVPAACPSCNSTRLHPVGAGTQKVEQILQKQFPKARLLRADADTLSSPEEMRELLRKMRDREADILLGTQSVVKGLDLPEVTLAAVILADVGLSLPHFRAGERVFQLLTQLTGRSGRAKQGQVIIQTFRPSAPEISAAASHSTEQFLDTELRLRAHAGYPPVKEMSRVLYRENDPAGRARDACAKLQKRIDDLALPITAKCAPTFFGGGREWQILLRGERIKQLLDEVPLVDAIVDVDPLETV